MKKVFILILCLFQMFNAGCASIVKGGRQTIHLETSPAGADVTIVGRKQSMISPADLVLRRNNDYEIEIQKAGYKTEYVQVDRHLGGWFWMNLLTPWGLLGMVVDMAKGSAYNLKPEEVQITLQPEGSEGRT